MAAAIFKAKTRLPSPSAMLLLEVMDEDDKIGCKAFGLLPVEQMSGAPDR